jgi:hypothetical protein
MSEELRQDGEEQTPAALTADDVNQMISSALGGKRMQRIMANAVASAIQEHVTPMSERFAKLDEERAAAAEREAAEHGKNDEKSALERKIAAQEKQIQQLLERDKAREAAVAEAERKARSAEEVRVLEATLRKHGASEQFLDFAVQTAHSSVVRAEDGSIKWKAADEYSDPLDLSKGVESWLDTDAGKRFLPAVPVDRQRTPHRRPPPNGRGSVSSEELDLFLSGE